MIASWLEEKQVWYVAIHRFRGPFAQGREILISIVDKDLEEAINEAGKRLLILIGRGPAVNFLVEKHNL